MTALIEGTFPDYQMVIPKKHDKEVLVETAGFVEAVRRTRTMTSEKFNSVRFKIGEGKMWLQVVTPEVGEYMEDMVVEYDGEVVEIAFNPGFVLEVLRRITAEKVSFSLKDSASPCLIKPVADEGGEVYANVIMPIRI